jgi:hypothetical protein
MRLILFIFLPLACFLPTKLSAQTDARERLIQQALDDATDAYTVAQDEARQYLLDIFDKQIEKAEANRRMQLSQRIALLEELETARKSFIDNGTIPMIQGISQPVINNYTRRLDTSVSDYMSALKKAADDFDKLGNLDAAKRILDDLENLKAKFAPETNLEPGMVFEGPRVQIVSGVQSPEFTTTLTIREVKEGKFYGAMTIKASQRDRSYAVDGTVKGTALSFRAFSTEDKFNQLHSGTIRNGVIAVQIKGATQDGKSTVGKMQMELKKEK